MTKKIAITIGRQYGSNGHEIARRLSHILGISIYDKELINLAAEKKGIDPDFLHRIDEKPTNSLLYTLAMGSTMFRNQGFSAEMSIHDQLFIAQTEIIKEIAERESAIFVGRCADYILRSNPNHISVFVYADYEARVANIMQRLSCSRKEAEDRISKTDKTRINYYHFYTGKKWGKQDNYNLSIDSSLLGVEGTAQMLAETVRLFTVQNDENSEK